PSRHRGWALVLVGGLGAVGGYVAASGLSAWLQPIYGWRILWFLNLPTGLLLIFMNGGIPESAKFLMSVGRLDEARAALRRVGCLLETAPAARAVAKPTAVALPALGIAGRTWALSVTAIAWGLINFGLLLWMPAYLVAHGHDIGASSRLLTASALIALPTVFVAAFVYSRWSSKGALAGSIALTALGLLGLLRLEWTSASAADPVWPVALLIVGINGIIAVLLPYAAESYPLAIRARATGWVAACTKGGGLLAQALSLAGLIPALGVASVAILVPVALSLALVLRWCIETRGRDLRSLDVPSPARLDPSA
ncbi:MAG: MFS transporter, partial [Rhizobacter sp.]